LRTGRVKGINRGTRQARTKFRTKSQLTDSNARDETARLGKNARGFSGCPF